MENHIMKLNPVPFYKIVSGVKKYELRLFDEKRQSIRIGDLIEFIKTDGTDKCIVEVVGLHRFSSFAELYSVLPLEDLGYSTDELNSASSKDMDKYYSAEQQKQYGVLAIEIRLLAN